MKNGVTRVLLYGAGGDCKNRIALLPNEWEIIGIVDKSYVGTEYCGKKVVKPVEIPNYDFDFIVIMTHKFMKEIREELLAKHIDPYKIIDGVREVFNYDEKTEKEFFYKIAQKKRLQIATRYSFENRSNKNSKMLYVLAGYKQNLWDDVFGRLRRFIPKDIDVCICSSGMHLWELSEICEENKWSYLSTEINDVSMIQNLVISLHPNAEWIFKMDEDIYLTKGCFEDLINSYNKVDAEGKYKVGIVGPMIPLHTTGMYFLDRFGFRDEYEKKFGRLCAGGRWNNKEYATNGEIPKWLWMKEGIDELNKIAAEMDQEIAISPIKYAICFVLFKRSLWNLMDGFEVHREWNSLGVRGDEGQIANAVLQNCLASVVSLNCVVGHFAYPNQLGTMIKLRKEQPGLFELK